MFSIFKKKTIIPHVRLTGIIGTVGKFKQGIDLASQQEILKKAFNYKNPKSSQFQSTLLEALSTISFNL